MNARLGGLDELKRYALSQSWIEVEGTRHAVSEWETRVVVVDSPLMHVPWSEHLALKGLKEWEGICTVPGSVKSSTEQIRVHFVRLNEDTGQLELRGGVGWIRTWQWGPDEETYLELVGEGALYESPYHYEDTDPMLAWAGALT